MPKLIRLFLILFFLPFGCFADDLVLVLDTFKDLALFRSFADSDIADVKSLEASGSAQFTESGLQDLKTKLAGKSIVIVDLRRESHGFIDSLPVSWMLWETNQSNIGWTLEQIDQDENKRLAKAQRQRQITIDRVALVDGKWARIPIPVTVTATSTESNLAAKMGFGYMRIPVSDHSAAEAEQINQLVALYRTKPEGGWLHFHCKGGKGRTTQFLTFWDMLANAKKDSFEAIIARQEAFSHFNLMGPGKEKSPFYESYEERSDVLRQFYNYCKENSDQYQTPFEKQAVAVKPEPAEVKPAEVKPEAVEETTPKAAEETTPEAAEVKPETPETKTEEPAAEKSS